jgi:aryl-alcohol dehydrogenase-like predicted oxidoreductase
MHPYVQDQRVTARRMRDLMTRSERIRLAHATKEQALLLEPIAMRDAGRLRRRADRELTVTMRYELLGESGLRVSELALGTMTFGDAWGWGAPPEEAGRIFDAFAGAGGNFIDTASNYTDGQSEELVGELTTSDRDHFVLATKYTLTSRRSDPNAGGNHRKNMVRSLERSLGRLRTDHVDLLWLHMWDGTTPVAEVLRAMDDLVRAGKVLHVGFSDTPAWIVSRAVAIAEVRGWTRPVAIQGPYSLADRGIERDLLPMAEGLGLAATLWGVLEGGVLTGKYEDDEATAEPRRYRGAQGATVLGLGREVRTVAAELGRTPAQVAIAWVRAQHRGTLIPILGARTEGQIREGLGALAFDLPVEVVRRLDAANPLDPGFPHSFLMSDGVRELIFGETYELIVPR